MEHLIEIKKEYKSLNELHDFLIKESSFECYIDDDEWDFRINNKGRIEECIVIRKNSKHAVKLYFTKENTAKLSYIIPNKMMHAYFGKTVRGRRGLIEIVANALKQAILAAPQQKAFEELEAVVRKAAL